MPDHQYLKFRLLLDKFKDSTNIPQMELPAQQDNTSTLQNNRGKRTKTRYAEPAQTQGINNGEPYEAPTQIQQTNTIHETKPERLKPQFEEIQTVTRKSKRVPKLPAKALDVLEYQDWYNKEDN